MNIWPKRTQATASSRREDLVPVQRVKIYGERKTGTTFMAQLIRQNFAVVSLSGTPDRPNRAERERLMQSIADQPPVIRRIVLDRIGDQENRGTLRETLGWKHMYPPISLLREMRDFLTATLFLVTVKHPIFWLLSYHRSPLDSVVSPCKQDFGEFLRTPFVPTLKDGVEPPFFASPAEFYAHKIDGYRQLADLAPRFQLVRYEDLISDVAGFIERMESEHGLRRRSDEVVIRDTSTNRKQGRFEDYREEYQLDRVKDAVSSIDYDFVVQTFGRERLDWLGYAG